MNTSPQSFILKYVQFIFLFRVRHYIDITVFAGYLMMTLVLSL